MPEPTLLSTADTGTTNGKIPLIGAGDKLAASLLPSIALTETLAVASAAARLALTSAQAQGKIVVEADTGKSYGLVTGGNPATSGDWIQVGDRDIQIADVAGLSDALGNAAINAVLAADPAVSRSTILGLFAGVENDLARFGAEYMPRDLTGSYCGGQFLFDAEVTAVADTDRVCGVQEAFPSRMYHAFPSLIRVGNQLIGSWMTATDIAGGLGGHTSKRGDLVIAKSDLTGRVWTEIHRFRCSKPNPADALVVGDVSYYYGGLIHLGGTSIGIALDIYNIVNASVLDDPLGYRSAWAISHDLGDTWSTPVRMPLHGGGTYNFGGPGEPVIWQEQVWLTAYSNAGPVVFRAPLANVIDGTQTWQTNLARGDGTINEMCFLQPVKNDDATLRIIGRTTKVTGLRVVSLTAAQAASPPATWTQEIESWLPPKWEATQPMVWKTKSGRYLHIGRGNADADNSGDIDLAMRIYYAESLGGVWQRVNGDDNALINLKRADYPAVKDLEKHMYQGLVPLGGDLFGCLIATDACAAGTFNNKTAGYPLPTRAQVGRRSSVWFTHIAAGAGKTTRGDFAGSRFAQPATPTSLLDIKGMKLALLASNAVTDGVGGYNLTCPISGLQWITPSGQSLTYNATGSANGKPALVNTGLSNKRMTFNGLAATLQALNLQAIYVACSRDAGTYNAQAVVSGVVQVTGADNWYRLSPLIHNYGWENTTASTDPDTILTGWNVYSFRLASGALTTADRLAVIMNEGSGNYGWNGRLTAILVMDRNPSDREHAEIVAKLAAL